MVNRQTMYIFVKCFFAVHTACNVNIEKYCSRLLIMVLWFSKFIYRVPTCTQLSLLVRFFERKKL